MQNTAYYCESVGCMQVSENVYQIRRFGDEIWVWADRSEICWIFQKIKKKI